MPWPRPSGDRPRLAAPTFVLETAAGRLANELLGSVRSEPAALVAAGFAFQDEDVRDVLAAASRADPGLGTRAIDHLPSRRTSVSRRSVGRSRRQPGPGRAVGPHRHSPDRAGR